MKGLISQSGPTDLDRRAGHHLSWASGEDPGLGYHLQHTGLPSTLIPNHNHLKREIRRNTDKWIEEKGEHYTQWQAQSEKGNRWSCDQVIEINLL